MVGTPSCRSRGSAPPEAGDASSPDDGTFADVTAGEVFPDASVDADPPDATVAEERCVEGPGFPFGAHTVAELAKFSDCTVLVGRIQEDSVRDLMDLAALGNVRHVEGTINIFRSPGFVTLHGLENLEEIDGSLFVHLNDNLTSIAALGKLRTVTGSLLIQYNPLLPQAEVDIIAAGITVGGSKTISPQAWE